MSCAVIELSYLTERTVGIIGIGAIIEKLPVQ